MMPGNRSLVFFLASRCFRDLSSGQKKGLIRTDHFPTNDEELNAVIDFAGSSFPDALALAMELKLSWIEATGLPDPSRFITVDATIPNFEPSQDQPKTASVQKGTRRTRLALVGMHVAGSVKGHPEMIWATFEHVDNTPNAAYRYTAANGQTRSQPESRGGSWLFSSPPPAGSVNERRLYMGMNGLPAVKVNAQDYPGAEIGPGNILRTIPWGTSAADADVQTNNTNIIGLNRSVIDMLASGDVCRNYILIGATFKEKTATVGGDQLANSTIEAFDQGSNCFSCHSTGNMLGGLRHIYVALQPLSK